MEIEWVILADSAEVINNKLYLMGGGWETLTVNKLFPVVQPCAVAVSILVPNDHDMTDAPTLAIDVADAHGKKLFHVSGRIAQIASARHASHDVNRVQAAVEISLEIADIGVHTVTVRLDGKEKDAKFLVVAADGMIAAKGRPRRDAKARPSRGRSAA